MRIVKANIPKARTSGMESIELSRLGPMVVVAGKNGAGKSRLFAALQQSLRMQPSVLDHEANLNTLQTEPTRIEQYQRNANALAGTQRLMRDQIQNAITRLNTAKIRVDLFNSLEIDQRPGGKLKPRFVEFVPRNPGLDDDRQVADRERTSLTEQAYAIDSDPSLSTTALIRTVQTRWIEATHPLSPVPAAHVETAKADYLRLNELVETFLGVKLERSINGLPTLFGKPLIDAGLSEGQSILLQLCVKLFAQHAQLANLIIFLDEPENHLHPGACIDVIEQIRSAAPDCQIWVATHSLPILSYFTEATLLFVENGRVEHSGSAPEKVFESLIGNDERVCKMRDFVALPATYAMNRYAAQCLAPPTTVGGAENDPQAKQIRDAIYHTKTKSPDRIIRVVDYGAGKGRLLENLRNDWPDAVGQIDYIAFDQFDLDADACKEVIVETFGSAENRYFNKLSELRAKCDLASVDVLVMCNVLHEIDPDEWLSVLGRDGGLTDLLNEDGGLLVVEDEEIPVGEMAHQNGFIVLDSAELKLLFGIKETERFIESSARDGRLKAHLVARDCVQRLTAESRKKALEERQRRARQEIIAIRKKPPSYVAGRKHAFWVQQYANAALALANY